jgi:hypothetical protein
VDAARGGCRRSRGNGGDLGGENRSGGSARRQEGREGGSGENNGALLSHSERRDKD